MLKCIAFTLSAILEVNLYREVVHFLEGLLLEVPLYITNGKNELSTRVHVQCYRVVVRVRVMIVSPDLLVLILC